MRSSVLAFAAAVILSHQASAAQSITATVVITVADRNGAAVPGARVSLASPALLPGTDIVTTNEKGHARYPALPPGLYAVQVELDGFHTHREDGIRIGAASNLELAVILDLATVAEPIVVRGRITARGGGFESRFDIEDLASIPTRRTGMFDVIRLAPGISPTSQATGTTTLMSAFGSGVNENTFLIDGTNFTSTSNGIARAEPGIGFIQEVQVQSIGASVEYGNLQGAVINVVTRSGTNRMAYDGSYHGQPAWLTSQPVRFKCSRCPSGTSGYERALYREMTSNLGGPAIRNRLWFFGGYQHTRDYDSQPGTEPDFPRAYEADKGFGKLTWRLGRAQLVQSAHYEAWANPEVPSSIRPFEATQHVTASVPALTLGHLTYVASPATVWDVRVGGFKYAQHSSPATGDHTIASRVDSVTFAVSGAPPQIGAVAQLRMTAKATLTHHRPNFFGSNHEWKVGLQVERGEHRSLQIIPTGERFVDNGPVPLQRIANDPSNAGGRFVTAAAFLNDAVTVSHRITFNAGLRFDHTRAISHDISRLDAHGHDIGEVVQGLGTLYSWNLVSPRLGMAAKLSGDGRVLVRASLGRFYQGILTGELSPIHPGMSDMVTTDFDSATGTYSIPRTTVGSRNVRLDRRVRSPRTDEFSAGLDGHLKRGVTLAAVYVRKRGGNFIGWTDVAGEYAAVPTELHDGRVITAWRLTNPRQTRLFELTNAPGYRLYYDGLVISIGKRRTGVWQASASYTLSRTTGLQGTSGVTPDGAQVSTVGAPPLTFARPTTFGRDRNDLTNASGRLPNDRPHMVRVMTTLNVPRTRLVVSGSFQHYSGKPWAATAEVRLPPPQPQPLRIFLETRGTRRLSSQSLLDLRIARTLPLGRIGRAELTVDVLNVLNDTAEESLESDVQMSVAGFFAGFGQPATFVDPRRVMIGLRVNLGRPLKTLLR